MNPHEAWRPERVIGPAAVAAALLLLSLHQVVSGAVRQAEQQRLSVSQLEAGRAECSRVGDPARRDLCISRLNALLLADER